MLNNVYVGVIYTYDSSKFTKYVHTYIGTYGCQVLGVAHNTHLYELSLFYITFYKIISITETNDFLRHMSKFIYIILAVTFIKIRILADAVVIL